MKTYSYLGRVKLDVQGVVEAETKEEAIDKAYSQISSDLSGHDIADIDVQNLEEE